MKKKILAVACILALVVTVVPMLVLADTTTVTATNPQQLSITVPSDVSFGDMTIGSNSTGTTYTISASGNVAWKVTAKDADLTGSGEARANIAGKMTKYHPDTGYDANVYLTNPLKIQVANFTEIVLSAADQIVASKDAGTEITDAALTFTQEVVLADQVVISPYCYRLVVTFTISAQ